MEWINIKDKLPDESKRVLIYAHGSYHVGEIAYLEEETPVFLINGGIEENTQFWSYLPNQPERSKREDHESGCGALNIVETQ